MPTNTVPKKLIDPLKLLRRRLEKAGGKPISVNPVLDEIGRAMLDLDERLKRLEEPPPQEPMLTLDYPGPKTTPSGARPHRDNDNIC
jgi:hypothetical protein